MKELPTIHLNPGPVIRKHSLYDDHFCVVIDNFLSNPQALIDYACENAAKFQVTPVGYPGPRLNLSSEIMTEMHRFIRNRMSKLYTFLRGGTELVSCLSITTRHPDHLANFQRLCHTDPRKQAERRYYAAMVNLFTEEKLGGTAFYRWKRPDIVLRALALEMQDPAAAAAFLAEHTSVFKQPSCYMTESNELAELITVVPPRFNRMIFYSGEIPHSGHVTAPELLSPDFRAGRLTLNSFASVLPR